ncbi:MAG: YARHG domain-containing protein [Pseudomonadota bacterium]
MNTDKKIIDIEAYNSPPCHSAVKDAEDIVNEDIVNNEFDVDEILNYITGKTSLPTKNTPQADSIPETPESKIDQYSPSEQEPDFLLAETETYENTVHINNIVNTEFSADETLDYITSITSPPIENTSQTDSIPEITESKIDQYSPSEQKPDPIIVEPETYENTGYTNNAVNTAFPADENLDYITNKTSPPIENTSKADSVLETPESKIDQYSPSEQEPDSLPTKHTENTTTDENVDVLLFRAMGKPYAQQSNTLPEQPPSLPHDNLPDDNLPSFVFSNKSKFNISYLIIGVALCVTLSGGYWFFTRDKNEQNNLNVQVEEQASKVAQSTPPQTPKADLPAVPPPSPPVNPPEHVAPDSNIAPTEAVKPITPESGGIIPTQTEPVKPYLESDKSVQAVKSPAISIGKASAQTGTVKLSINPLIWGKYPEGSTRLLTVEDINGINPSEIRIIKNEIFARHSCIFKSPEMKEYFSKVPWYTPQYNDVTSMLTPMENANVAFLIKYEK